MRQTLQEQQEAHFSELQDGSGESHVCQASQGQEEAEMTALHDRERENEAQARDPDGER